MFGWDDLIVLLVVGAAAAWCVLWARGVWNRKGMPCACDQVSCPASQKLKALQEASAAVQEGPAEDIPPDSEKPAKALSN